MKHVFTQMLGVQVVFTTKVEDFIAHEGPKITYCKQALQNEFHIKSNELLFEQGFDDIEITVQNWEEVPCFFPTSEKSVLPFDIFAASFYLLSRYEEYVPHVKDEHGRFPAKESLAYKHGFLEIPVVDVWVARLKQAILRRFPDALFPKKQLKILSVIDVPCAYTFKKKGLVRSIGGSITDILNFKFKRVLERYKVLFKITPDPSDNFEKLLWFRNKYHLDTIFFFLVGDYGTYDKNISINNKSFKELIKSVADYSIVSLMASYNSFKNIDVLREERKRLINIINQPIKRVRLRFARLELPQTYKDLVDADFTEDYTMGYQYFVGFRAGTCTPFRFYDLSLEMQTILKVNPICIQDDALKAYGNSDKAEVIFYKLYDSVKKVNGYFITVFSNESMGNYGNERGFRKFYLKVYKKICTEN
ncbi:polysaccharide deacetylase family protein [Neptunitalea chrysea]|nr:polysaccharide deacetylase family protein [Neptunitalea chrysea]